MVKQCFISGSNLLRQIESQFYYQARSYVQARGGSCLLVPRRLNFSETQIKMRNCIIGGLRVKIVATRCQILWLKCTKFDFDWGSDPDLAAGAYSCPLAGFKGPTSLSTCLLSTHVALCQRVRGVIARTRYINVLTYLLTYISSTIGSANFSPDWPLLFKVHEI